ncbi:MAG: hypothetical protein RLZZ314_1664 [Bacteroidota bacterium]
MIVTGRSLSHRASGVLLPLARTAFALAFLVVLAGSVVRMTGSGMGCPDWPRCFGLMIPPTHASEVTWTEGESYTAGRMIVAQDTLWVAQEEVEAFHFPSERSQGMWLPYTQHDYAVFNPVHTWVEFINRLLGALAGIPALLLLVASALARDLRATLISLLGVIALGAVAWLGKLVVDGNLIPHSITLHMLGAVAILAIDSVLIQGFRGQTVRWYRTPRWALLLATFLTLGQIVTGTEVRELVDVLLHEGTLRSALMSGLELSQEFVVHRSGIWVLMAAHVFWMWRMGPFGPRHVIVARNILVFLLLGQLVTGLLFVYGEFPAWAQPLHLVIALAMFTTSWGLWWRTTAQG